MTMTMGQIKKVTPADRFERAQQVKVTKVKYGMHRITKLPTAAAVTYSVEIEHGRPKLYQYVSSIEFLPKKAVKLSCSCPDFLYRWEYALNRQGAADIKHSNGEHPDVRNPKLIPGCCKHLLKLHATLVQKQLI